VAAQCRFTDEQQATILDHFVGAADRTAGGVLQAVSSAAQVQENADVAYEMERLAFRSRRLRAGAAPKSEVPTRAPTVEPSSPPDLALSNTS
jgi:hypothetical protein